MSNKNEYISAEIPYLPPVEWFVKVLSYSTVYLNDNEPYDKRTPRNRCVIATAQGAQLLSVPLQEGRGQNKPLKDIRIANDGKWQRLHINAIKTAYGKTPYFIHYFDEIAEVISSGHEHLYELNTSLIQTIVKQLKLAVHFTEKPLDDTEQINEWQAPVPVIYRQVFSDKTGFIPGCSIIDLLFNHGPDSVKILHGKKSNA